MKLDVETYFKNVPARASDTLYGPEFFSDPNFGSFLLSLKIDLIWFVKNGCVLHTTDNRRVSLELNKCVCKSC